MATKKQNKTIKEKPVKQEVKVTEKPVVEERKFVTIESAIPNKQLEVSVNDNFWKGQSIRIPQELEGEVRRILKDGGFVVKN